MADVILDTPIVAAPAKPSAALRKLLHNPAVLFGGTVIAIVVLMGLLAPWLGTIDPIAINPIARNKVPGAETDVLNGIAYDAGGDRLFVTGKLWPKIFEIKIVKGR